MEKFSSYINKWLYDKDGYYSNYKTIGKEGDFYTSVSTSIFFGGSIAKKIVDCINNKKLPKNATIVEVGAHHGYLFADIIQFIYTLDKDLLNTLNFAIVERFDTLQEKQKRYIRDSFGNAINFKHYKDISELKLDNAFIIANEIFDAFACELVFTKDEELQQAYVENHKIIFKKCEDEKILKYCKEYKVTKGEVPLGYKTFVNNLCKNIKNFHFITFDYGDNYPRNDFSIRIYSKHNVFPLFEKDIKLDTLYKNSDITFDVFFKYLISCFKDNNIKDIQYKTQTKALIDFGITDLLETLRINTNENNYLKEVQKVKTLLEPTGMGERFKMLYISNY